MTTIKWSIFDRIDKFVITFVKNVNSFTNCFVIYFVFSWKNEDLINDNIQKIFIHYMIYDICFLFVLCFLSDIYLFLNIDVSFADFFFDDFNVCFFNVVIYEISRNIVIFTWFENHAFDVIIINEIIHLISTNIESFTYSLHNEFVFTWRKNDHYWIFSFSNLFFFIYHNLLYIL